MRVVAIALLLVGCASAPPPAIASPGDLDGALASWVASDDTGGASRILSREDPRPLRAPVRIARREAPPLPPGRAIDVRFDRAPLASALSLLAEQANLGLVVAEGVEGSVSASLTRVRPLAAMQALAEAHHVELTFVGRTVIARSAGR